MLRHPSEFVGGRIGIITPYKCQLSVLRSRFSSAFGSSTIDEMEFNTVDGFQGREVDILILSTVRAAERRRATPGMNSSTIGFVADVRRMNVALTRARLSLWIMGNAKTLQTNQNWAALIKDAQERNLLIRVKQPYGSMFRSATQKSPAVENSENNSTKKQTDRRGNETIKQKTNYDSHEAKRRHNGDAKELSTTRGEECRVKRKNARDGDGVDLSPGVVHGGDNKTSKDGKPVISGKSVAEVKTKGKEETIGKKIKLDDASHVVGKRKSRHKNSRGDREEVEQRMGDNDNTSISSQVSKKAKAPSGPDRSTGAGNLEVVVGSNPKEGERDSGDKGRAPNQVGTSSGDRIAKRKQQREAVDAILYSALIPSNKSQAAKSGSAKKPPPSSMEIGGMKPPKARKH